MSHFPPRPLAAGVAAVLSATAPFAAIDCHAEELGDVRATVRTLGLVTGEIRPGSTVATDVHAPTLELLSVDARNVAGTGLFGSMYGFLAQQWASGPTGKSADLMTGHVGWEGVDHRVKIEAGRLAIFAGAPRYVFLDGAAASARLPGNLRLDGYGGSGVYETFKSTFQAPVYGGRLAWTPWEYGHIGVAAQNVDDLAIGGTSNVTARRTIGVDASLRAWRPLLVTGSYAHDVLSGSLQEARLDAAYRYNQHVAVHLRGEIRDPLAFLPKTSIFNAFVARTDGMVGSGFDIDTPGALSVSGGYDRFLVPENGLGGYRSFLDARLRVDAAGRYKAGAQYGRLYNGDNGYDQIRVYVTGKVGTDWTVTADLDGYKFFRAIHDETMSTRALLALRWAARPGIGVGVDAQVWRNPYFETQAMGMATLTMNERLFVHPVPVVALKHTGPDGMKLPAGDDDEDKDDDKGKADDKAKPDADAKPDAKAPDAKDKAPDAKAKTDDDDDDAKPAGGGKP